MSESIVPNKFYVYVHRRATDGKVFYVGKGRDKRASRTGNKRNPHWHNVVKKHGHTVHFVDTNLDETTAFELEVALIDLCGRNTLCNMTDGGEGISGMVHTSGSRSKMSVSHKGVPLSAKHRESMSSALMGNTRTLGYIHTDAARAKMSAATLGVPKSVEAKANMSRARKGVPNGPMSDAHKAKIGAASRGRVASAETLKKLSAWQKGVPHGPMSDSRKAALRASFAKPETKAKHKAAMQASRVLRKNPINQSPQPQP